MIFEKVREIIAEKLAVDEADVKMDSCLNEDLDADSMDLMDIVFAVEDEYELQIPQEELLKMKKVSDLVGYIENNHG